MLSFAELVLSYEHFFGEGGYDHRIEIKTFDVSSEDNKQVTMVNNGRSISFVFISGFTM